MKRLPLILFITALILTTGCRDLLEEDLDGYGLVLLTPPDGYSTSANVVELRWESVPRAEGYRVQVATPDFQNPVSLLHDSLVTSNTFSLSLSPGAYRWRVRAENPNSHTSYYERALTITESASLEGLTPLLSAPVNNSVTAADTIIFNWQALPGADDHRFEVRVGDANGSLVHASITAATEVRMGGFSEGTYAWGVQGQNATSASLFAYRTLTIDRTAPGQPTLTAPANSAELPNAPFTFQWTSGQNAGTSATDSLFVNDTDEQTVRRALMNATSYEDSLGLGTYTWYIRTTDAAGNGTSSTTRTFTIE